MPSLNFCLKFDKTIKSKLVSSSIFFSLRKFHWLIFSLTPYIKVSWSEWSYNRFLGWKPKYGSMSPSNFDFNFLMSLISLISFGSLLHPNQTRHESQAFFWTQFHFTRVFFVKTNPKTLHATKAKVIWVFQASFSHYKNLNFPEKDSLEFERFV